MAIITTEILVEVINRKFLTIFFLFYFFFFFPNIFSLLTRICVCARYVCYRKRQQLATIIMQQRNLFLLLLSLTHSLSRCWLIHSQGTYTQNIFCLDRFKFFFLSLSHVRPFQFHIYHDV